MTRWYFDPLTLRHPRLFGDEQIVAPIDRKYSGRWAKRTACVIHVGALAGWEAAIRIGKTTRESVGMQQHLAHVSERNFELARLHRSLESGDRRAQQHQMRYLLPHLRCDGP